MSKKNPKVQLPEALTQKQGNLITSILEKEMVITYGPAGTGKSFIPAAMAAYLYSRGSIKTIVLTRPVVPVGGKGIGFFPGDLEEKMEPWVRPFVSVLEEYLSIGEVECMIKNGKLQVIPFDVIRGHTFDESFVVLDEAQNTTITDIKAFVTRIGQDSKTVINGDLKQSDLRQDCSGLEFALNIVKRSENLQKMVDIVQFDAEDIVRSGLCKEWVKAFP